MQDSVAPVSMSRINEMTAGDPSFLKEIVDLYLMDATELVSELKKHVGAADAKSVQTVAHKLKGSSLNMGANGVAEVARRLEQLAKAGVLSESTGDTLLVLEQELQIARDAFERLVCEAA